MNETQVEKLMTAIKDTALMRADLFWCIGKLRGLGYPAEHLEIAYKIKEPPTPIKRTRKSKP